MGGDLRRAVHGVNLCGDLGCSAVLTAGEGGWLRSQVHEPGGAGGHIVAHLHETVRAEGRRGKGGVVWKEWTASQVGIGLLAGCGRVHRGEVRGELAVCGARGDAAAVWCGVRSCVGDEDSGGNSKKASEVHCTSRVGNRRCSIEEKY